MKFPSYPDRPVIADRAAAEGYIGKVCFKTGPPRKIGVELEWTVHHLDDPARPLDAEALAAALGSHAPTTLRAESQHTPLPRGGLVTVEPGGQVEISTAPHDSLGDLAAATAADVEVLTGMLATAGLAMGSRGCDPYRPARRILNTPRYAAMERAFDRVGPHGRVGMCGTAAIQVCLDAGTPNRVAARWLALHSLGPVLVAVFANSSRYAGRETGWVSARMRAWLATDPARTQPPSPLPPEPETIDAWSRRVLDTPLLCIRNGGHGWDAPAGVSFADWIGGALGRPPTYGDLDYHLTTLFPPVRARGYLEVRYLDAQPGDSWLAPVAVLAALFANESTVDEAARLAAPAADRWSAAARDGLADPILADVAARVLDLACRALGDTDLPAPAAAAVTESVHRRLTRGGTT